MANDPTLNEAAQTIDDVPGLVASAVKLQTHLRECRLETGDKLRGLQKKQKIWQTCVVLSTSLSTGLAGYTAQEGLSISWRMVLAIVVAVSGAVAAVRDAWRVNQTLDETKERYAEIHALLSKLEEDLYEAEGKARPDEKLGLLRRAIRHAEAKLKNIGDDLIGKSG